MRWLLLVACVALAPTVSASGGDLAQLSARLKRVRSTQGANEQFGAGEELTPIKHAVGAWVERHLPVPSTIWADPGELRGVSERMNRQLAAAGLFCRNGAVCSGTPEHQPNDRGYLDDVRLGWLDHGRYLLVVTGVGLRCGFDQSAYLYEREDRRRWRLLFASETDRYGEKEYSPRNFIAIDASPADAALDKPAPPPLVALLSETPWCSSNWNMLGIQLSRASRTDPSPPPLIDRSEELYRGDDFVAAERLNANELLVEYRGATSIVACWSGVMFSDTASVRDTRPSASLRSRSTRPRSSMNG